MIYANIPQPLPFYAAQNHRRYDTPPCIGARVDGVYFGNEFSPAFVIERDPGQGVTSAVLRRRNSSANYGMSAAWVSVIIGGREFLFFNPSAYTLQPPDGEYMITVGTGGGLNYYSEWFRISSCIDKMTKVQWSGGCKEANIPWSDAPDGWDLHFWVDTVPGPSVVTTSEEVEDDGQKEVVTSVRTVARTSIVDVLPDYMLWCLHSIKHHPTVLVTEPSGYVYAGNVRVGDIAASPLVGGCKQTMNMQVIAISEVRSGCCDEDFVLPEPCLNVEFEAVKYAMAASDREWYEAQEALGEQGLIVDVPNFATVVSGGVGWFATLDALYRAEHDLTLYEDDIWYYIFGPSVNDATAYLLNPQILVDLQPNGSDYDALAAFQDVIPDRLAALEVSNNGGPWVQIWSGTEADLVLGISGSYAFAGRYRCRVRYYTQGCEYGYGYDVNTPRICVEVFGLNSVGASIDPNDPGMTILSVQCDASPPNDPNFVFNSLHYSVNGGALVAVPFGSPSDYVGIGPYPNGSTITAYVTNALQPNCPPVSFVIA